MKQIIITLDTPEIQALERAGDKSAMTKVINITVAFRAPLCTGPPFEWIVLHSAILQFSSSFSKKLNFGATFQASRESIHQQITKGKSLIGGNSEAFALIIDGKSLAYALEDDMKDEFLQLSVGCSSVICCRSSPKQKALVSYMHSFKHT